MSRHHRATAAQPGGVQKPARVKKISASLDAGLVSEARAALRSGESLSGLLNDALEQALIARRGLAAVAEYEKEHGPLTDAELAEADLRLTAL